MISQKRYLQFVGLLTVFPFLFSTNGVYLSASLDSTPESHPPTLVVVCPIQSDIMDGTSVFVDRIVKQESQNAKAILFLIDTFGGKVDSAMDVCNSILESPVPTVAFISGRGAISAGALVAYACDHMFMAPGANIGASTPIMPGVEMSPEMNEKSMSFLRAKYRALGEEKGHNPLIGEAMVDPSIELYGARDANGVFHVYKVERNHVVESYASDKAPSLVDDGTENGGSLIAFVEQPTEEFLRKFEKTIREILNEPTTSDRVVPHQQSPTENTHADSEGSVVQRAIEGLPPDARLLCPAGKLLTLTTREAEEIGLIRGTAETPEEALHVLGLSPVRLLTIEMNWAETIFAFLTSPMIAGLLLLCGISGIYIEFRTPGLGWPGIIGATCLALFFGSRLILGIADWLDVLFVVGGLILLAVEIFVIPGFGIVGITGIVCVLVGIYLSLIRVPIPHYTWDFVRLRDAGITLMVASALLTLFLLLTWQWFPRTRLARALILSHVESPSVGYTVQTQKEINAAIGLRGITTTMLRPSGRGRFGKTNYDIVSRGEFISEGRPVEIIEAQGNRYVVREISEENTNSWTHMPH